MRSVEILQAAFGKNLSGMHPRREAAMWRAVIGLIIGGKACLTALGRSLPGATSDKHRIKAVDRLLGNAALHREIDVVYRAVAHWLLKHVRTPVIAVDWTGAGAHHYELSAKLCSDGRALPLYSMVFAKHEYNYRGANRQFLRGLASILPFGCVPIVVTDAGFGHAWFRDVRRLNWHYIGRIRGGSHAKLGGRWYTLQQLHRRAGSFSQDLGVAIMTRNAPQAHRLVLAPRPTYQGRKRMTRRGTPGRSTTDRSASKGAREPWVLATSLQSDAAAIVRAYRLRMQIEESFRDRKSARHGWSMHLTVTRNRNRMAVLLMLASLAELAVQLVGRSVATTRASFGFQANTTRNHRVLSFFFMGCRACRIGLEHTARQLHIALLALLATLERNARPFAPLLQGALSARQRPRASARRSPSPTP